MPRSVVAVIGVAATVVATWAVVAGVDGAALRRTFEAAGRDPLGLTVAVAVFAAAFVLRAAVWCRMVPGLPFGQALAAVHLGIGANHVLPLRLGEGARVVSVVRRTDVPARVATASTVTLRSADVLTCAAVAAVAAPRVAGRALGPWGLLLLAAVAVAAIGSVVWLHRLRTSMAAKLRLPGLGVVAASAAAWCLEAVVVLQCARWAGLDAGYGDAAAVLAASVAAQLAAVAPGGFGTYEAAAVATWVALGFAAGPALVAALTAHAVKTAYSLVAGGVALVSPAPGLIGRFRLPRRLPPPPAPTAGVAIAHDAPVVLFLPARNEEGRVGDVVRRLPPSVCGRPTRCIVIDDGSTDGTAAEALEAGATVVALTGGHGLGAGVRRGLQEAVALRPAAVAFCDADGEYGPEELDRLVTPILEGRADYVVGSRFAGDIRRMLPHRRFGNRVLTVVLSFVARRRISDGQSGYRAFSPAAAEAAEVVHDFNYAQVLTLDLLAKGFRYEEVPITYAFRTSGRSFVRLGRYLRAVVPAVWRELNGASTSVLDDVAGERSPGVAPVDVSGEGADGRPGGGEGVVGVVVGVQP